MAAPTPPTAGNLTGAGYTLANGVYSKTFGSIVVNFVISDEPDTGTLYVQANGDVSATDIASAQASLGSLGYANASYQNGILQGYGTFPYANLGGAGGCTYYGQSL